MSTLTHSVPRKSSIPSFPHIARKIGVASLTLFGAFVAVLLCVPLLLLPLTTAVPALIWITLIVAAGAVAYAAFHFLQPLAAFGAMYAGFVILSLLAVWASQLFAATPPITDANGKPLPNSIAVMEKVNLGGSEQWITIRGKDVNKPVLLYLGIGGPGAGGFPANFTSLQPLEDHFVVVNWDQPGTGKSYDAVPISTLTVDRFVSDAHELTQLLRARFHQEKIYVMGLSWGTILGTKLVHQYPELFHAYLGMGQMVNTTENDRIGYELALRIANERGDMNLAETLRRNGPPPYGGEGMALKYAVYNNVLFDYMGNARLELILTLVPQLAREYGLWDRVNFDRGLIESFAVVYPQLRELDFTTEANQIDVPMYFLHGHNDVNATASLVERYFNVLQAPRKELIWLESGHSAGADEILDAMLNHVLPQTQ